MGQNFSIQGSTERTTGPGFRNRSEKFLVQKIKILYDNNSHFSRFWTVPCLIGCAWISERWVRAEPIGRFDLELPTDRIELVLELIERAEFAGDWLGDGVGRRRPTFIIVWSIWYAISGWVSRNFDIVLKYKVTIAL